MPPEGVKVETRVPIPSPAARGWVDERNPETTFWEQATPERDDLAVVLFNLKANQLSGDRFAGYREFHRKERIAEINRVIEEATRNFRREVSDALSIPVADEEE